MLCALTVRKLKPGTFEDFKAVLRGGPIWPDTDIGSAAPKRTATAAGWTRFYALRNVEDEDEVITFGPFDGSLSELRAQQQASQGYGHRRRANGSICRVQARGRRVRSAR
jgi:hypothetical protein